MTWVVDASVAVKWFVDEVRSAEARAVLASGRQIIAPDLIIPETCKPGIRLRQQLAVAG